MDYQTITLPSNVNDAFSGQTNTRSSYTTKIIPCFFRQGEQLALDTILYPIDYTADSAAIASNDNRWYVICDLITSDLSHFPDPRVICSLVPKPPQTGDTEHFTHMRPTLEWYPVNKLGLVHSIYISVVDSQFKPVVFNSRTVTPSTIMEGVKFEDMMDWIQGLQGMEDIAKAFSHSTRDDLNMSHLQIQWKLDHEVQQAFKCLKPALTNCIKALVDFKQKNEVTQTPAPVPVVEEPKQPMQEDQPKNDDYHNCDDYSDDESDYSLLIDDDDDQEDELMIEAKSKTHKSNKPRPKSPPKEQPSIDYKEVLNNIKTKKRSSPEPTKDKPKVKKSKTSSKAKHESGKGIQKRD